MMKLYWHELNVEDLQMVNKKRSLIDTIRQRQKSWIGHIV